jgi:hypothetical protein
MPIVGDQLKWYLSGGANNNSVFASLGGPISMTTQIRQDEFNNLWGDIGALDLKIGVTQYRAVYLKNESNNTVFENPRSWFAIKDPYVSIQWTKLGVNKRVALLASERSVPPADEVGAAPPPPPPETVARFIYPSGNVTASSSTGGNIPGNTNDQSITTGWVAPSAPAWLAVDLGITKYIHYIKVRWALNTVNEYDQKFTVETSSDGIHFTNRATGSHHISGHVVGAGITETVSFEHHNARHVRITGTETTNPLEIVGIGEFEVWGVSEVLALDVGGWAGATEDLATTQSACPNIPPLSYIGLWLRRIIPPNDVAFPTLKQTMKLEVVGGGGLLPPTTPAPPAEPAPPVEPPPTEPPAGQLGPYASTGKQLSATTRRATRHYASGKSDDETIEKNTKNIPYDHYQCVYFVTMHGTEHDDNVSSKLGGTHMGSGWLDHGVSFNSGKTCLGTEPNHPDTNSCIKTGPNIGSIIEKRIGICTIWRKPKKHTELWTKVPGGNWIKQLENTGSLGGFTPDNDDDDEAQLRIDGFEDGDDPTIDVATVQEIAPA